MNEGCEHGHIAFSCTECHRSARIERLKEENATLRRELEEGKNAHASTWRKMNRQSDNLTGMNETLKRMSAETVRLRQELEARKDPTRLTTLCNELAKLREENARLERLLVEFEAENIKLDGRRREGRQLLHRLVNYVREDRAETPGTTRLARLTDQVSDYLNRTQEPRDILR